MRKVLDIWNEVWYNKNKNDGELNGKGEVSNNNKLERPGVLILPPRQLK